MSKYQEALDNMIGTHAEYYRGDKDVDLLQELVDKETPKIAFPTIRFNNSFYCPKCKQMDIFEGIEYCYLCGQHIDWSLARSVNAEGNDEK